MPALWMSSVSVALRDARTHAHTVDEHGFHGKTLSRHVVDRHDATLSPRHTLSAALSQAPPPTRPPTGRRFLASAQTTRRRSTPTYRASTSPSTSRPPPRATTPSALLRRPRRPSPRTRPALSASAGSAGDSHVEDAATSASRLSASSDSDLPHVRLQRPLFDLPAP